MILIFLPSLLKSIIDQVYSMQLSIIQCSLVGYSVAQQGTGQLTKRSSIGCCVAYRVLVRSEGCSIVHRVLDSSVGYSVAYWSAVWQQGTSVQLREVQGSSVGYREAQWGTAQLVEYMSAWCCAAQLRGCSVVQRLQWSSQGAAKLKKGCIDSQQRAAQLNRIQQRIAEECAVQLKGAAQLSGVQHIIQFI